jgi:Fe-Mn family superoxide dismutase
MYKHLFHGWLFLLCIITSASFARNSAIIDTPKRTQSPEQSMSLGPQMDLLSKDLPQATFPVPATFQAKRFDFSEVTGLSNSQLSQHVTLYQGYVKKRNEIAASLRTVDRTNVAGITYSPYRGLKVAETFAFNGTILHELYFQNLGTGTQMGPETKQLLIKNFGSIANFKKDVIDAASCARGWVLTCYSIDDGKLYNFLLDAHNETVPVLVLPILVIDTYEHAYMIDFGIDRAQYLKTIWENINWDVVEMRIKKWVNKFIIPEDGTKNNND